MPLLDELLCDIPLEVVEEPELKVKAHDPNRVTLMIVKINKLIRFILPLIIYTKKITAGAVTLHFI